jgi:hypothetical protein
LRHFSNAGINYPNVAIEKKILFVGIKRRLSKKRSNVHIEDFRETVECFFFSNSLKINSSGHAVDARLGDGGCWLG